MTTGADTQALLSELARIKVLFQMRTVATVINGGIVCTDDECERIFLGARSDTLNHTADEHAQHRFIGGTNFDHGSAE